MESLYSVLDTIPASMIMYMIYSALLILALGVNLYFWRRTPNGIPRRLVLGLLLMLVMEITAFIAAASLGANSQTGDRWLAPLDRFQMAIILIWLLWLWAFPETSIWGDVLAIITTLGTLAALVLTLIIWPASAADNYFNAHWLDTGWQIFCLFFALLMIVITSIRRKHLWGAGVVTGMLFVIGHGLHLLLPYLTNTYSIPVRLATLIALPLLCILPQGCPELASEAHAAALRRGRDKRDRRRFSTELPTALGFLSLVWEDTPQTAMQLLIKSFGRALLADVCLFTTPPNQNNQVTVLAGHDFYNHVDIKESRLDRQRIPRVMDALSKNNTLRLSEDYSDSPDAAYLCRLVHFSGTAPLLFHPVSKTNAWQVGGILLLTPYSRRDWTENDSRYVAGLTVALLRIIEHKQAQLESVSETQKLSDEQRDSSRTILNLQNELQELSIELEKFQGRISGLDTSENKKLRAAIPVNSIETNEPVQIRPGLNRDATVHLNPLVVEKHDSLKEIARLKDENEALRQLIAHISAGPEEIEDRPMTQPERELRSSLKEVARLKNMLANADMELRQLERRLQDEA